MMQRIAPLLCSSLARQLCLSPRCWRLFAEQVQSRTFPQRIFLRNASTNEHRRQRRVIERTIPQEDLLVAPSDISPLTELSVMPNFRRWHAILVQLCGNTDRYVPSDEWERTYKEFQDDSGTRKQSFFGSMMTLACSFRFRKLGDSILDHFHTKQLPFNIVVASRYIKLLGRTAGEDSAERIVQTYEGIRKHFPGDVYDIGTAENLVAGLYQTTKWKDCFKLLQMMDYTGRAGPMAVSFTMAGAFLNKDHEAAMKLVNRLKDHRFSLTAVGFAAWFEYAKTEGYNSVKEMLSFIRNCEWYLPLEVVRDIKTYFESLPEYKWTGKFTTVTLKGECKACHEYMEAIVVKKQEFEELQKNFIRAVIEGTDVFLHTNPQELQRYRDFVEQNKPFDVVVDGLNVAYHQGGGGGTGNDAPKKLSKQLRVVVEHLLKRTSKKVLIVGRRHMLSWPGYEMGKIRDRAHLFFAENSSQDDPFVLYAAMSSGLGCAFLSGDLMRDHRFKLALQDDELRKTFLKWQRTHQMELLKVHPDNTVTIKSPMKYVTTVQWTDQSLHIPYNSGLPLGLHELPSTWLCLTKPTKFPNNTSNPVLLDL